MAAALSPVPQFQTAIIQSAPQPSQVTAERAKTGDDGLPVWTNHLDLAISQNVPVPSVSAPHDVLVRVLAVALNPTDHKMTRNFAEPGGNTGCDFCGVVVDGGAEAVFNRGLRVCGGLFPYGRHEGWQSGAFAQFVVSDSRLMLRVPEGWSDLQGAALGGIGWATATMALSDPDALALPAFPSEPASTKEPVLVYGGATATGTMACQLLMRSGYMPIAVTSAQSAKLALDYGAHATVDYASGAHVAWAKALAGQPIRHALDCITDSFSSAACFAAIARTGGRYACLESLHEILRTRRAVRVREVMGFEALNRPTRIGGEGEGEGDGSPNTYTRGANPALFALSTRWAVEMQKLLDEGLIKNHPVREVEGQWDGILNGLVMLQKEAVRGQKLVVRISGFKE